MRRAAGRPPGTADRRKVKVGALFALLGLALSLVALYAIARRLETGTGGREVRGDIQEYMRDAPSLTYAGVLYTQKKLTTVLLMGIDKSTTAGEGGFRNGGQADFLLLLLIDTQNKTITPLQIDRDTMTEITILGVLGNDSGTRTAQICLAHGFGDGKAQSCLLTQRAVSNLLPGVRIDSYVAMNLEGIRVLNDAVGGVTVTLEDDFSALDPAMKKGVTLTLQGAQAEYFVRNRRDIGAGTNEARMQRQGTYLKALRAKLSEKYHDDSGFADELFDALEPYLQTDMKRGRIINQVWKTRDYEYGNVVRPEGRYSVGADGFMEFHPDEDALQKLIINLFYRKAD